MHNVITFPVPHIEAPEVPRMCWPCLCTWLGMPAFWAFVIWVVMHGHG